MVGSMSLSVKYSEHSNILTILLKATVKVGDTVCTFEYLVSAKYTLIQHQS